MVRHNALRIPGYPDNRISENYFLELPLHIPNRHKPRHAAADAGHFGGGRHIIDTLVRRTGFLSEPRVGRGVDVDPAFTHVVLKFSSLKHFSGLAPAHRAAAAVRG